MRMRVRATMSQRIFEFYAISWVAMFTSDGHDRSEMDLEPLHDAL